MMREVTALLKLALLLLAKDYFVSLFLLKEIYGVSEWERSDG